MTDLGDINSTLAGCSPMKSYSTLRPLKSIGLDWSQSARDYAANPDGLNFFWDFGVLNYSHSFALAVFLSLIRMLYGEMHTHSMPQSSVCSGSVHISLCCMNEQIHIYKTLPKKKKEEGLVGMAV